MYRRATRTNGKAEDDAQLLLHQDSGSDSSPKRGSRRTPNPFRNPKRIAVHPSPIVLVCACASLCCLLSCLVGFMTLRGTINVRRNAIPSALRTFTHNGDERFVSPTSPGHKVLHRRTLTRVSRGNEDEYSRLLGPIGREEDESKENQEHSDDNPDDNEDEFTPEEEEHSADNREDSEDEFTPEEENEDDECIITAAWENDYDMACNSMHEIDVMPTPDSFNLITCGNDRCVFRVTDIDDSVVVLKTLKYERPFEKWSLEKTRMDAFVMTKLTSSPYVMGIYGYCGLSQVVEYGANGNIHDLVKVARETGEDKLSPLDRLRICVQIATAVADMHSLDVSHNDLCCHQYILVDGVYRLSDFDFSEFVKRNRETNETCLDHRFGVTSNYMKLRPPEEQVEDWEVFLLDRTKVDNYMMGNIMYYVLTTHWLFEGHTRDAAVAKIVNGERSHIAPELLASESPAIQAIVRAIKECWSQNPRLRPSSRKISDLLKKELGRIEKVDELGVVRVSVPPLPVGFRHTDSDFVKNMGVSEYHDDDYYDEDRSNDGYYNEDHSTDDQNNANAVRDDDILPATPVF